MARVPAEVGSPRTAAADLDRYQWTFGLLFLDIDHFKTVNDRYGHDIGDDVLRMAAATLAHTVRASDPVARYGGEELVVVLPHADRVAVQESAERLRALIARVPPGVGNRRRVAVTVGIGGTLVEPEDTAASLLSRRTRCCKRPRPRAEPGSASTRSRPKQG